MSDLAPAVTPGRRRPSYLFLAIPILATIAITAFFGIRLFRGVTNMDRLVVPGERDLALDAGDYVGYLETSSVVDGVSYNAAAFSGTCNLTSASGEAIRLESSSTSTSYSFGSYAGHSAFGFTVPTAGTYHLACSGEKPAAVIAIGGGIGMGIVTLVISTFGGIGVTIVLFFVIRRRRKRG